MHILLITHFLPPKRNAGTENYTLGLAQALIARGHTVHAVCVGDWEVGAAYWNGVSEDVYNGVPISRINLNWTKSEDPNRVLYDSLPVERWLEQLLAELKPDIVHVTSAMTLGVGTLRATHKVRIPLVLTLTDFWFICPSTQLLRHDDGLCSGQTTAWDCQACLSAASGVFRAANAMMPDTVRPALWGRMAQVNFMTRNRGLRGLLLNMEERKRIVTEALGMADRIFAPSEFVRKVVAEITDAPVEVLRHGHNLSWLDQYDSTRSSDRLCFGYVGQIRAIKGVHVLIRAFQNANFNSDVSLNIWGDPTIEDAYATHLGKSIGNSATIAMCGRFNHESLGEVLAGIDVLVVPSLWYENSPLVIQEAFAARIPVIATDLGGMAEAVTHDVDGLLFARGDVDDLSRQMRRIIDEPGLLEQLKKNVPRVRTVTEEVSELEMVYTELNRKDQ